ncbi:hypothetical protein [Haloarchaeobius sp. DFWS5]|uniref:hypothetical protein n=1 Tax=Haloarchaeobius sp. DFWS5 TaxID=3446114 RepID=UPI003EBB347C
MTTKNSTKLSRRQVLAGLGTIGVASAGAGLGTTAFFSDTERLQGWYEAGRVDLILDYRSTYMPWERYDLQMVPEDERPAIVKDTDGMTYEIGAAPAIRYVESGEALSHEEWGRVVTGATDIPTACNFDDPTDISNSLPARFETVRGGTYLPGYVDGQDNGDSSQTAMFVDLVDIKPHDSGETTFSFHLCGNPSFLYVELVEDETHSDEDYRDGVTTPTEPEREAGEPDEQTGAFEGGELCDYLYVVVSPDPNCDNRTDSELLGPEDEDDGASIDPIYAGSMSGWIELIRDAPDGKLTIPPVNGAAGDPVVDANCFQPGVHCYAMEWYLPCQNEETEDGKYGFADLPVFNNPEIGSGTFAEELVSRGYEDGDSGVPLNANITQTDTCHVGLQFTAEQCRHNTTQATDVEVTTNTGWVNVEENFNGDASKTAEGHARRGNTPADQLALRTTGDAVVDGFTGHAYTGGFENFTFEYDGAGLYTFTVGGNSVSGNIGAPNGRIGIQTKADEAVVEVQNLSLALDGTMQTLSGPTSVSASNAGSGRDLRYLVIDTTAGDLANGFTVAGEVKMTDNGATQQESFAFDVVVE